MHVCLLRIRLVPQRITSLHEPDSEIIYFLVKRYRRTDGETQHALCIKKNNALCHIFDHCEFPRKYI